MIRNICVERRPLRVSTMKVKITTVIILVMCTKYTTKYSLTQQGACCSAIFHPLTGLIQTTDDYFPATETT